MAHFRVAALFISLLIWGCSRPAQAPASTPTPDSSESYVVLVSSAAQKSYHAALAEVRELHPNAVELEIAVDAPERLKEKLVELQPRYALVVITPEELSVDFALKWLWLSTELDDDPLVDVSTGFLTGAPEDAVALMTRTRKVASGELKLEAKLVDDLGPNTELAKDGFQSFPGSAFLPVYRATTISHGAGGMSKPDTLSGFGLVHFGGHGYPDRIVDGLTSEQLAKIELSPCVVFNGACYTGVTSRWYENGQEKQAGNSFCLQMLKQPVLGYFAALHADHGMPVYQEMEYLAYTGASLGDVMRETHNAVILGFGGKLPERPDFSQPHNWHPSEIMLYGTASRVFFGDPALRPFSPITDAPFELSEESGEWVAATQNTQLKSTYTDTFHSDLSQPFNERIRLRVPLPDGAESFEVELLEVEAGEHRQVGRALEKEGDKRWGHLQIDTAASGFFQSPLRERGCRVRFRSI